MRRKKQSKEILPPVSQLPRDSANTSTTRLGLQVIVGEDGKDVTKAIRGDNMVLYAGRAPQDIIDNQLLSYVCKVTIHAPRKSNERPVVLTSVGYGGRVVQQQRPYA